MTGHDLAEGARRAGKGAGTVEGRAGEDHVCVGFQHRDQPAQGSARVRASRHQLEDQPSQVVVGDQPGQLRPIVGRHRGGGSALGHERQGMSGRIVAVCHFVSPERS